jgi:hypothetical protein
VARACKRRLDIGGEALSEFLANILQYSHPHLTQQVTQPQIQVCHMHCGGLFPMPGARL